MILYRSAKGQMCDMVFRIGVGPAHSMGLLGPQPVPSRLLLFFTLKLPSPLGPHDLSKTQAKWGLQAQSAFFLAKRCSFWCPHFSKNMNPIFVYFVSFSTNETHKSMVQLEANRSSDTPSATHLRPFPVMLRIDRVVPQRSSMLAIVFQKSASTDFPCECYF